MTISNRLSIKNLLRSGVALLSLTAVVGCSNSDDTTSTAATSTPMQTYRVTVTNLSANQPLSPLAVILHNASYAPWSIGGAASAGLEHLAEGGDNSTFITEAKAANVLASMSSSGATGPGSTASLDISTAESSTLKLSIASMLVNTNDGFTGINSLDISDLAMSADTSMNLFIYDAGTEANNELKGSIPGPADGGEGFNSARDDVNFVAMHPGAVTQANGYSNSVLDQSHRFDAPIARLTVMRVN